MDCPECSTRDACLSSDCGPGAVSSGDDPGAALCPHCLTVQPVAEPPGTIPTFEAVGDAFPDGDAAVPMALVLGLLPSLATYREELGELFLVVERAGTDPLLVLDRLADDSSVTASVDLGRRRRQLEQLL